MSKQQRYKNFIIMNYTEGLNNEKLFDADFSRRTCMESAVCHNKAALSQVKAFSTEYFALAAESSKPRIFHSKYCLVTGELAQYGIY